MRLFSTRVHTLGGCRSALVEVEGEKIVRIEEARRCPAGAEDYGDLRVIPGIFDTHNHGTLGYDLMDASKAPEARRAEVRGYLKGLASQGVTSVFPTVSDPAGVRAVAEVAHEDSYADATVRGIHSEGPWLSRTGEKGTREPWPPVTLDAARELVEAGGGLLRLVALAPEIPGIGDLVDYILAQGVTVAAAHSDNTYAAATAAYARGISVATHTGNVMTDMHHRDVGGLGAALLNDAVTCEVICDGMHVCNEMLAIYFRVKDPSRFVMVSDSTAFAGAPAGTYHGGPAPVMVVGEDGFVRTDAGRIMGSSKPVLYGIGNLVENVGVPLDACLRMASENPARTYGLVGQTGAIAVGRDADLVVVSDDWQALVTYARGRRVYDRAVEGDVFNPVFLAEHLDRCAI